MRRLEIEFYDSNIAHGWEHKDSFDDLALAIVIGFFKSEDDEQITLTMGYSNFDLRLIKLTIPKNSIKSIRELRVK